MIGIVVGGQLRLKMMVLRTERDVMLRGKDSGKLDLDVKLGSLSHSLL